MPGESPLDRADPRRIGSYRLVGRLGAGGQGVVYLAQAPDGRRVAVKVLHARLSNDPKARQRLLREIEATRRVRQFCTARVLDVDTSGDRPYVVSEYVPGPTLAQLVRTEGPRGPDALERLAIATLTALSAIHQAGIVHRDFKPGNIIYGPDGPRVIDFGLARLADAGTATTDSIGTPAFIAPEVIAGATADARSDLFGWGVTMVFAGTGDPAFGSDSIPAVLNRILHEEPALEGLAEPVRSIVAASLSKRPADRPTATEALLSLLSHNDEPEQPEQPDLFPTLPLDHPTPSAPPGPPGSSEPQGPPEPGLSGSPGPSEPGFFGSPGPSEPPGIFRSPAPSEQPGLFVSPGSSELPGHFGPPGPPEPPGSSELPGQFGASPHVGDVREDQGEPVTEPGGDSLAKAPTEPLRAEAPRGVPGRRALLGAAAGTVLLAAVPSAWLLWGDDAETGVRPTPRGTAPPREVSELAVFPTQPGSVYTAIFSADGEELFTSGAEEALRWDVAKRKVSKDYPDISGGLEPSPDGRALAAVGSDGVVRIVETGSGRQTRALSSPSGAGALAWSPDGQTLATASRDGRVRLWDLATGAVRATLTGHTDWVTSVAYSPDGRTVATASNDRTVRLWDAATGAQSRVLTGHTYWVQTVRFSLDGTLLASGGTDTTVRLWDPVTGRAQAVLNGHKSRVNSVHFSPDGTALASASHDRTVRLWDTATGSPTAVITGHTDWVLAVGFTPDGTGLVSAGSDRTIRLWRIN